MATKEATTKTSKTKTEEVVKMKGKYISSIGRRKSAVARIRIYKKGTGVIIVNDKKINTFFDVNNVAIVKQPMKLSGHLRDLNVSIVVKGGGSKGQAEAARYGIVKALIKMDEELKQPMKAKGWLTRDARVKERKKPGLKKARRAPQWSKR